MIKLKKKDVEKEFKNLGFDLSDINDSSFRASHSTFLNVVVKLDEANDELQVTAFFTGKKDTNRGEFLDAVNSANQRTTITNYAIDNDGDLVVRRCLPARGGFTGDQLSHIIKEGDREVQQVVGFLTPHVE